MKQRLLFKTVLMLAALLLTGTKAIAQQAYAVLSDEGQTVTFYYDTQKESRGGIDISNYSYDSYYQATAAVIDASFADYRPTSTAYWFYLCSSLTSITGIENLKTDDVTDMNSMFNSCRGLKSLDVSGFKTDNVTDMSYMFTLCSGLTSLDVSGFKTDNVTNMSAMFSFCSSLTSLDVSGFKTDNVTNMSYMFTNCYGLKSLDVSGFKTDNVTNMTAMFGSCNSLKSLDVSGFKTDNVKYMISMFSSCSSLTSLDMSGFKTDNVKNMSNMFYNCSGLTTIYASDSWITASMTNGNTMFGNCTNLVGGQGTAYDPAYVDHTYARIDGGEAAPGYFTDKLNAGVKATSVAGGSDVAAPAYSLGGQRLTAPQRGINIVGGRKVMVK